MVEVTATDDGTGLSDTQMITVNVQNANEAPEIISDGGGDTVTLSMDEGNVSVTTVTATDVDDPTVFIYSITGGDDQALFDLNDTTGVLTFESVPDFETPTDVEPDNIYEVEVTVTDDGVLASTDAQVITVTIDNLNDNDPIFVSSDGNFSTSLTVDEDQYAVLDVNATDKDGDVVTYLISGGADRSSFQIDRNSGQLDFNKTLPPPDFDTIGAQVFVVEVNASDETRWDLQQISVTLRNLNDPPVPNQFSSNNEETTGSGSVALAILGDAVEYRKETDPEHGTLTWSADNNGSWSYDPDPDYFGQDEFKFRVYDSSQPDPFSPVITVFLNVVNVNDVPVITQGAGPLYVFMSEDGNSTAWSAPELNATDADPGDVLTWSIETNAFHGTASFDDESNASTLVYAPDANYNGSDSFVVLVSDGESNDSITVNVDIASVDDSPVIVQSGPLVAFAMTEDNASTWTMPVLDATDVDTASSSLTWSVETNATNGIATVSGSGSTPVTFTYVPNADFNGTDNFVVRVSDGVKESSITVQVPVEPVNDAPDISQGEVMDVNMSEDGNPVAWSFPDLNATDVDNLGAQLAWSVESNAGNGIATVEGNGTSPDVFTYVPADDFNGSDSFVVLVSDGESNDSITVNVIIASVNDAP